MLFWTAVIAVATIAYVYVSSRLLKTNSDTLKLTQTIFEATNRPFIAVDSVASHASGKTTRPELVFVRLKNVGNLPSKNLVVRFKIVIDKSEPKFTVFPSDKVALFPTAFEGFTIKFENPDTMSVALNSHLPIDVFLELEYTAVSDKTYTTKCHHTYNHTIDGFRIADAAWT